MYNGAPDRLPPSFLHRATLLSVKDWFAEGKIDMSATTVCKLALLVQCTLTASWHPNFPGSSLLCHGSYRKSLGHLLLCPPPPFCLISFHHLSSSYGVVHFILSADGEGFMGSGSWTVLCYTGHAAYSKNVRWMENMELAGLWHICVYLILRGYIQSLWPVCSFIPWSSVPTSWCG